MLNMDIKHLSIYLVSSKTNLNQIENSHRYSLESTYFRAGVHELLSEEQEQLLAIFTFTEENNEIS